MMPPETGDGYPIVDRNGCPEGALGRHKFSCQWAGGSLFFNGQPVTVHGEKPDGTLVCVVFADGCHDHVVVRRRQEARLRGYLANGHRGLPRRAQQQSTDDDTGGLVAWRTGHATAGTGSA